MSKKIQLLKDDDPQVTLLRQRINPKSKRGIIARDEDNDDSEYVIEVAELLLSVIKGAKKYCDDPAGMRGYLGEWKRFVKRTLAECAMVEEDDRDGLFLEIITRYTPM